MSTFRRSQPVNPSCYICQVLRKTNCNLFVANSLSTNTLLYISKDYPQDLPLVCFVEETFDISPLRCHDTENAGQFSNCHVEGNRCLSAFFDIASKFLKSVLTWFFNARR